MNGVVLLVGGLLLVAVIKLIMDRNWIGLLLCAVALLLVFVNPFLLILILSILIYMQS